MPHLYAATPINVPAIVTFLLGLISVAILAIAVEMLLTHRSRKTHHAMEKLGYILTIAVMVVIGTSVVLFTDLGHDIASTVFNH